MTCAKLRTIAQKIRFMLKFPHMRKKKQKLPKQCDKQ